MRVFYPDIFLTITTKYLFLLQMWSYAVKLDFMYAIYKFQMYPDQTYPLLASLVRSKNHVNWHKNNQKFNNYWNLFWHNASISGNWDNDTITCLQWRKCHWTTKGRIKVLKNRTVSIPVRDLSFKVNNLSMVTQGNSSLSLSVSPG